MTRPTEIRLLRHAHSTANEKGILAGRDKTVHLSERGMREAAQVELHLRSMTINRVVSSPLPRARQTIAPFLSQNSKIESIRDSGIIEMDYGDWSGKKLSLLSKKPLWRGIQRNPASIRFPAGESFLEMLERSTDSIRRLALPGKTTLFVSHGDVIKAIVAHYLGMHLDNFQKIAIDPASLTRIVINEGNAFISYTNSTSHLSGTQSGSMKPSLGGGAGSKSSPSHSLRTTKGRG